MKANGLIIISTAVGFSAFPGVFSHVTPGLSELLSFKLGTNKHLTFSLSLCIALLLTQNLTTVYTT